RHTTARTRQARIVNAFRALRGTERSTTPIQLPEIMADKRRTHIGHRIARFAAISCGGSEIS
ncbi:hypothetical protein, partial [Actinoplanes sp. NPDC051411]|uniref:hypothetical protein n=1 Tax=Actinoplanes sp. NPDC051411 TaxID=3155522 RepID=UPI00342AC4B4